MDASNRSLRVNLTGDGVAKLRERVKEKLKEFMGDYTDDTLVEYVIVLLRNGRQEEEARKELDVFLGDDSQTFVSWLWDHLASNSLLHTKPREFSMNVITKEMEKFPHQKGVADGDHEISFDHEKKSVKARARHSRVWNDVANIEAEPLILQNIMDDDVQFIECHRYPRKPSPVRPQFHKKRDRQDVGTEMKKQVSIRPKLDAPRRLLQFAVRDAVRNVQSTVVPEPSLKRLRSVVSTSMVDMHLDKPLIKSRSVAIVGGAAITAAEAIEDVRGRVSGNVFDRLGCGSERYKHNKDLPEDLEGHLIENGDDENSNQCSTLGGYGRRSGHSGVIGDVNPATMAVLGSGLSSDSCLGNENFDNISSSKRTIDRSGRVEISSLRVDKGLIGTHLSSAQTSNEQSNSAIRKNPNPPLVTGTSASQKTLNISINVDAWKPQDYQVPEQLTGAGYKVEGTRESTLKLKTELLRDYAISSIPPKNDEIAPRDDNNETQKVLQSSHGVYPGSQPTDDANSRTVFVSNVHFAATKDDISRHFNKFGEVLKVIIATHAITGQPKGSAYVEFLRKESAELALSMNGTSFMLRILKVVMRSAAPTEAVGMFSRQHVTRSPAYPSRLGSFPYLRSPMASSFRARFPLKSGPRSLQWKRDNPDVSNDIDSKPALSLITPGSATISPSSRNFTYVRPELKSDGNVGLA